MGLRHESRALIYIPPPNEWASEGDLPSALDPDDSIVIRVAPVQQALPWAHALLLYKRLTAVTADPAGAPQKCRQLLQDGQRVCFCVKHPLI